MSTETTQTGTTTTDAHHADAAQPEPSAGPPTPAAAPLSTHSGRWAIKGANQANKDLHVQTTDPLFGGGQVKTVTVLEPEEVPQDGPGDAVRLRFKIEEEITSDDGIKRAPGYLFRPMPFMLQPNKPEDEQQADIGRRTVGQILEAVKILPKGRTHRLADLYAALDSIAGKQLSAKFSTKKSTKRGDDGEFKTFQNVSWSALGDAKGGGTSTSGNNDGATSGGAALNNY